MTINEYRDFLKKQTEFNPYVAVAVNEVMFFLEDEELDVNDDQFQILCNFVYEWITYTETKSDEVCRVLIPALKNGDLKWEDFDTYTNEHEYTSIVEDYIEKHIF